MARPRDLELRNSALSWHNPSVKMFGPLNGTYWGPCEHVFSLWVWANIRAEKMPFCRCSSTLPIIVHAAFLGSVPFVSTFGTSKSPGLSWFTMVYPYFTSIFYHILLYSFCDKLMGISPAPSFPSFPLRPYHSWELPTRERRFPGILKTNQIWAARSQENTPETLCRILYFGLSRNQLT